MTTNRNTGIYIHIPFCLRKCPYCDFYSIASHDERLRERFVKALVSEIEAAGKKYGSRSEKTGKLKPEPMTADTVYFGGGTPSLLEPGEIEKILYAVKENFMTERESENSDGPVKPEISLECNPATATEEKLRAYRKAGINRLSIGAQSFDDDILKTLGRLHSAADTVRTVEEARRAGFDNISLDLMFAIPGQTEEMWEKTLRQALDLRTRHISFYSLEFMEGTAFSDRLEKGEITETSPEADRKMYEKGLEILADAGFAQYEISNAAEGREYICRHNMKYWELEEYLGFGPSAHSYVTGPAGRGKRFANTADVKEYIEATEKGECHWDSFTENTLKDDVAEYVFTGLRKNEGISLKDFRRRFGLDIWDFYAGDVKADFESFVQGGFADETGDNIKLTVRGMNISNRIMALFV